MATHERALQLRVGMLIALAVALLAVFVFALGNFSLHSGYRIQVDFDFSGSLQAGAPVKISGIKVGKVEEVGFWGGRFDDEVGRRVQVRVTAFVEERAREAIRQDAAFYINTQGVLGEQYVEIVPGSYDRPPLAAGSVVRGVDPPRTDLIVARLYDFLDSVTGLLHDDKKLLLDALRSATSMVRTLDGLLQQNREEIARLLVNVDRLTGEASSLLTSIKRGVGDASQLQRTLANVEALSASIRRDIDPLMAGARNALDGVNRVAGMVGPAEKEKLIGALDGLVTVSRKIEAVTADVQVIVASARAGKGTAGALLVDPQVYDDLKEMVRDLKRNPWKFFWKE